MATRPRGGPVEKSNLYRKRFIDLFESVLLLGEGCGNVLRPTGPPIVFLNDGQQEAAVISSKPWASTSSMVSAALAVGRSMTPLPADLGIVADAAQQAVGDARCATGAQGDLRRAVGIDGDLHHLGGAFDDEAEFLFGVELEAEQDAKTGAQGRAEQAGTGVAPINVKGRISMTWVRAAGPWADDDVEFVNLERGVELFFEDWLHAVNFVEEEHLALAEVGEDGGEIALNLGERGRRSAGSRRPARWK